MSEYLYLPSQPQGGLLPEAHGGELFTYLGNLLEALLPPRLCLGQTCIQQFFNLPGLLPGKTHILEKLRPEFRVCWLALLCQRELGMGVARRKFICRKSVPRSWVWAWAWHEGWWLIQPVHVLQLLYSQKNTECQSCLKVLCFIDCNFIQIK